MEAPFYLFPCTRMHDLMRAWHDDLEHDDFYGFPGDIDFEEVELRAVTGNGEVDFMHEYPDFTFNDFWQLTRRKIVWMGPEIFVESLDDEDARDALLGFREWFSYGRPLFSVRLATSLGIDEDNQLRVCSRSAVPSATTTVCDHIFQLMTRSNIIWEHLEINVLPSISTLALSQFLNNSRSSGGNICFEDEHLSNLS